MIAVTIAGRRMYEHGQTLAMKHQPWNDFAKLLWCKSRLIHSIKMGPDRLVMPATNLNMEISQTRAHPRRRIPRFYWVIINVSMITFDHTLGHRTPLR